MSYTWSNILCWYIMKYGPKSANPVAFDVSNLLSKDSVWSSLIKGILNSTWEGTLDWIKSLSFSKFSFEQSALAELLPIFEKKLFNLLIISLKSLQVSFSNFIDGGKLLCFFGFKSLNNFHISLGSLFSSTIFWK